MEYYGFTLLIFYNFLNQCNIESSLKILHQRHAKSLIRENYGDSWILGEKYNFLKNMHLFYRDHRLIQ